MKIAIYRESGNIFKDDLFFKAYKVNADGSKGDWLETANTIEGIEKELKKKFTPPAEPEFIKEIEI